MTSKLSLSQIERIMEDILSPKLAQSWDNVGLLVGNPEQKIERILFCIDLTEKVLQEAKAKQVQLIFAYHPPIFDPLKNIRNDTQPIIFSAIRNNIAIYSIHTALDVIDGGTSDVLADTIELENRRAIEIIDNADEKTFKLVIFVPIDAVNKVANAIFNAGAGKIGEYTHCSFRAEGTGTFLASPHSNPAIGRKGNLEQIKEVRLETLVHQNNISHVIQAMLKAHPYETPAFDIYPRENIPRKQIGLGRIGTLKKSDTLLSIAKTIKRKTGLKHLIVSDAKKQKIRTAACCPGACGKFAEQLAGKIDLFVTGEMRHHSALYLAKHGTSVICLGHGNSERIALPYLCKMLKQNIKLKKLKFIISKKDIDPLQIM